MRREMSKHSQEENSQNRENGKTLMQLVYRHNNIAVCAILLEVRLVNSLIIANNITDALRPQMK
jgi:hypothetical protein